MEFIQYYNDNYLANPELDIITDVDPIPQLLAQGQAIGYQPARRKRWNTIPQPPPFTGGIFWRICTTRNGVSRRETTSKRPTSFTGPPGYFFFLQDEACEMAGEDLSDDVGKGRLPGERNKLILCYYRLACRDKIYPAVLQVLGYFCARNRISNLLNLPKELFLLINEEKPIPWLI